MRSLDSLLWKKFRIGDHGKAFLLAESRQGAGLNDDIETLHGINADAVEDESDADFEEVSQGPFGILELVYKHNREDLESNYRLYIWMNRSNRI